MENLRKSEKTQLKFAGRSGASKSKNRYENDSYGILMPFIVQTITCSHPVPAGLNSKHTVISHLFFFLNSIKLQTSSQIFENLNALLARLATTRIGKALLMLNISGYAQYIIIYL